MFVLSSCWIWALWGGGSGGQPPHTNQDPTLNNQCYSPYGIHVWIYPHLVDLFGKCRQICHIWTIWVGSNPWSCNLIPWSEKTAQRMTATCKTKKSTTFLAFQKLLKPLYFSHSPGVVSIKKFLLKISNFLIFTIIAHFIIYSAQHYKKYSINLTKFCTCLANKYINCNKFRTCHKKHKIIVEIITSTTTTTTETTAKTTPTKTTTTKTTNTKTMITTITTTIIFLN